MLRQVNKQWGKLFSTGGGTLQFESGTQVKGEAGTPVYVGQTLSTGTGSHMHVQMMDGHY